VSAYFKHALDFLTLENPGLLPGMTWELQRRVDRHRRWLARKESAQGAALPGAVWEFFSDTRLFYPMERLTQAGASMLYHWVANRWYFSILSDEEVAYCVPVGMGEDPEVLQFVEVWPFAEEDRRELIWFAESFSDWVFRQFRSATMPF